MNLAIQIARMAMYASAAILFACLSYQAVYLPKKMEPRISRLAERLEARDEQVKKILSETSAIMEDNYWTTKANVETTAVILRDVSEITRSIRSEVIPELTDTLKHFRLLIKATQNDLQVLSASGNETIKATTELVRQLDSLTEELEVQVKQGSPKVFQTVETMDKLIADIDKQVNNPDLYAIAGNVKNITGNTAEITKTVDITTRPLREKVKLIKLVLLRVLGMIRITPF